MLDVNQVHMEDVLFCVLHAAPFNQSEAEVTRSKSVALLWFKAVRKHRGKRSIVRSLLCSLHSLHSLSENLTFTSDENN